MTQYAQVREGELFRFGAFLAAFLLAAGVLFSSVRPMVTHAQGAADTYTGTSQAAPSSGGTGGTNGAGTIVPNTTIDVTTQNPTPVSNADTFGGVSTNTWVILVIVVIAVALIIVGWGMGSGNNVTHEDIRREVHVR